MVDLDWVESGAVRLCGADPLVDAARRSVVRMTMTSKQAQEVC